MRFTIKAKLSGSFLLVALFFAVISYGTVKRTETMHDFSDSIVDFDVPRVYALLEMKSIASEIQGQALSFRLVGGESAQEEGTEASNKKYELLAAIEKMNQWESAYREKIQGDKEAKREFLERIAIAQNTIISRVVDAVKMKEEKRLPGEIVVAEQALEDATAVLKDVIAKTGTAEQAAIEVRGKEVHNLALETTFLALLMAFSGSIFALLAGFIIAQFFSARVIVLRNAASEIARGNLTKTITVFSRDEIGELGNSFNQMARNLAAAQAELEEKNRQVAQKLDEVERLNKLMVGRELKMIELKKEIKELKEKAPGV